jgi:hypothetical protein
VPSIHDISLKLITWVGKVCQVCLYKVKCPPFDIVLFGNESLSIVYIEEMRSHWAPVAHICMLTTWEAKIRRIWIRGQPRQIVFETPSPK